MGFRASKNINRNTAPDQLSATCVNRASQSTCPETLINKASPGRRTGVLYPRGFQRRRLDMFRVACRQRPYPRGFRRRLFVDGRVGRARASSAYVKPQRQAPAPRRPETLGFVLASASLRQLAPQQFVDLLRVGFTFGRFHYLTDQRVECFLLA